jgi:SAM-dependent methyltransferase
MGTKIRAAMDSADVRHRPDVSPAGRLLVVGEDRDVAAFDRRAAGYDQGWLGRMHREIADRVVELALAACASPNRVLDVGSGTGYLLRSLAARLPDAVALSGVDLAPAMVAAATAATDDPRLSFTVGPAEKLPYPDGLFDLAVSTTSFDHWRDQAAGLAECARVLRPGGTLVLCDQFSRWLTPTMIGSRRGKARTRRRATALLGGAGFGAPRWHSVYTPLINAVVVTTPAVRS